MEGRVTDPEDRLNEALDAWDPQAPPSDFAERVLARTSPTSGDTPSLGDTPSSGDTPDTPGDTPRSTQSPPGARHSLRSPAEKKRSRAMGAAVVALFAAAAAFAMWRSPRARDVTGDATAQSSRSEVAVGGRALAVLEPGAHLAWKGDLDNSWLVTQDRGDIFYRVEHGGSFRVHTPSGDVTVHGTCFRVKVAASEERMEEGQMNKRELRSGVIGAALSAVAFVAVYEGKVAVSRASESVDLGAGEAATADGAGVHKSDVPSAQQAFDAVAKPDPLATANQNLADDVREYKHRLEAIENQKAELEKQLTSARERLAASESDGAPAKSSWDLSRDDWAELAESGTVKFRIPCDDPTWSPNPGTLSNLGLAPGDAQALKDTYARSRERQWRELKPLCTEAIGSADVAERLGSETCMFLIMNVAEKRDAEAASEAQREVAEIRAGLRPMPGPGDHLHPVLKMFLALTDEPRAFEADLAQSFGPDEAHRLAFADRGLCMQGHNFGGPGPRKK
jgi:ferric-dicitrate binding protein FerR (iron transport regulator)